MPTTDHTDPATLEPVRRSVVVRRPVAETFALFTDGLDGWWPLHTHSIAADTFEGRVTVESITFEKRAGGRVLERMSDGTEAAWGTIRYWEPPTRFVMSWKPNLVDGPATEVELVFTPVGADATRIDLEHRGWELLGDDALKRAGYAEGWERLFTLFRAVADAGNEPTRRGAGRPAGGR